MRSLDQVGRFSLIESIVTKPDQFSFIDSLVTKGQESENDLFLTLLETPQKEPLACFIPPPPMQQEFTHLKTLEPMIDDVQKDEKILETEEPRIDIFPAEPEKHKIFNASDFFYGKRPPIRSVDFKEKKQPEEVNPLEWLQPDTERLLNISPEMLFMAPEALKTDHAPEFLQSFQEEIDYPKHISATDKPEEMPQEMPETHLSAAFQTLQTMIRPRSDFYVRFPIKHPLGVLDVHIKFKDEDVEATFLSDSEELTSLLSQNRHEVEKLLKDFSAPYVRFHYTGAL